MTGPTQIESCDAVHFEQRQKTHSRLANALATSSDEQLLNLIAGPEILEQGHTLVSLPESDATCAQTVFAKLVPLTTRDMLPANRRSSANLFRLPTAYQYRIGTCGGGAWRELEAQVSTSDWVLAGTSSNFPLLHHWRVLPIVKTGYDDRLNVGPWGGCPEIRARLSELREATSSLVLFLEYFPLTLTQWLRQELSRHDEPMPIAQIVQLEQTLTDLLAFVEERGLLHLDAHFDNILTDGRRLYLTDFGLALSRRFQLDSDEVQFFDTHANFDLCTATTSLVHAIVTRYDSRDDWRQSLRDMLGGEQTGNSAMPVALRAYVARKAPVALMIGEFYNQLMEDQHAPYPAAALQELLTR